MKEWISSSSKEAGLDSTSRAVHRFRSVKQLFPRVGVSALRSSGEYVHEPRDLASFTTCLFFHSALDATALPVTSPCQRGKSTEPG